MAKSVLERWEEKYIPEPNSGCWLWLNRLDRYGYGQLRVEGQSLGAHRVSWKLHYGKIPEGLLVRHDCDTPSCVNPDHLRLGTNQDNVDDRDRRGRNGNAKKTHCPQGHELQGENLVKTELKRGKRICRICCNAGQRARWKPKDKV